MRLSITVGFKGSGQDAEPVPLYAGRDYQAAIQAGLDAIGKGGVTRAQVFTNPTPHKKLDPERVAMGGVDAEREANLARAAAQADKARAKAQKKQAKKQAKGAEGAADENPDPEGADAGEGPEGAPGEGAGDDAAAQDGEPGEETGADQGGD